MAEIGKIVRQLQKKKNLDVNLTQYITTMYTDTYRLSSIRLTLNYPTFYELYRDKQSLLEIPVCLRDLCGRYVRIAEEVAQGRVDEQAVLLQKISALRQDSTDIMQVLSTFTDRFSIYEYVMNRVEYNFREDENENLDMDVFRQKLLAYITADKDGNASRMRMTEVIEQLPMRMSRSRFFQVLQNGLSVYKGSQLQSVKDVIETIRTCAMLDEPKGFHTYFPDLDSILSCMTQSDYGSDMSEARFHELKNTINSGLSALNAYMDIALLLQELINDTNVVILSLPNVYGNVPEEALSRTVLCELSRRAQDGWGALEDTFFADYDELLGKQEECYANFNAGEGALEDLLEMYAQKIEEKQLTRQYQELQGIARLLSGSLFAQLQVREDVRIAQGKDIDAYYESLAAQLREFFREHPKNINRAVMAKIITHLPPFITRYDELESYIETSLMGCRDKNERAACVEILQSIMDNDSQEESKQQETI